MIQFVYLEISKKKYKTSLIINNAFLGTLIGNFVNTFLINLHTKSSNKITNTITFSLNAILVNYLPGLVTQYLKHSFNCERPLKAIKELHKIHTESWWPVLHYNSFPSGHTTSAFALLIFMTVFIFPKNNKVVGLLFAMAIMVGISRIYLAAHFFKDIYLGSIVGFSIAILVILGYQLFAPKKHKIYVQG
jgi:membrane-associated phospholipid phosphatase